MKSDAEFYFGEYLKCCTSYQASPSTHSRQREFYYQLSVSMLKAYTEAVNEPQKGVER